MGFIPDQLFFGNIYKRVSPVMLLDNDSSKVQRGRGQQSIYETIVLDVGQQAVHDSNSQEKGNQRGEPCDCSSLLPTENFQATIQGSKIAQLSPQVEQKKCEFRQIKIARICRQGTREETLRRGASGRSGERENKPLWR